MTKQAMFFLVAVLLAAPIAHGHPAETAADTVRLFHEALEAGDREAALAALSPDVVIFESGGAELSREEYASQHLKSDMEHTGATTREIVEQRSGGSDDITWVLTRSRTTRTVRKRKVARSSVETMLLERTVEGWHIIHVHWSSGAAGN